MLLATAQQPDRVSLVSGWGSAMAKAVDVFVPSKMPTITYIDRSALGYEERFRNACEIPNMVVSVSGPSKCGKTVLIKKIITDDNLIAVSGSSIRRPEDLWNSVLDWMGTPISETTTDTSAVAMGAIGGVSGELSLPFVAKGAAQTSLSANHTDTSAVARTANRGGLAQVVREIGNSSFVVFIDDFHYISLDIQNEIGRQIKAAAEFGVKIITASVPHRSDDVVRSNPELRGRVCAVDIEYWNIDDLKKIARSGFNELNIDVSPSLEKKFAEEAFGSPQLMQTICLTFCFDTQNKETRNELARIDVSEEKTKNILENATFFSDYSTLIDTLHAGPKQRGTERKIFSLNDGSSGDVYRTLLLSMRSDPPKLSLRYDEMIARVRSVCVADAPVGSSVSEALAQMDKLAQQVSPTARVLEWDADVLDIVEPYFLFFLRCSDRLASLKEG